MGEALPGTNLAANAAVRYPRATAPHPSPSGPFRPVTPILFSSNGCTGRIALRSWVITSFPSSMVPFPPQRCETYSLRPHLLSKTKSRPCDRLSVTSSHLGTKLIYDCLELPANLAGSCSESLMLVIRQKCGTSRPTFLLTAIIRAKLARIITSDQLDPKLQVRVMRTNLVHIIHFRPTWAEVPYPCYL